MKTSDTINELAASLAAAQGEIKSVTRNKTNPFFNSRYADLAACLDVCREPLAKHGLSVVQCPSLDADGEHCRLTITTRLMHASGQWVEDEMTAATKDAGPQAAGSAITYLRRYSLCSMVGLAPDDDDDGNAVPPAPKAAARKTPPKSASKDNGKPTEPKADSADDRLTKAKGFIQKFVAAYDEDSVRKCFAKLEGEEFTDAHRASAHDALVDYIMARVVMRDVEMPGLAQALLKGNTLSPAVLTLADVERVEGRMNEILDHEDKTAPKDRHSEEF